MNPAPIDQQITFLYTRSMAASAAFYENVLGFRLARDQGGCRIYHVCGSAYVGMCERVTAPEKPAGVIVTIVAGDVDEWHRRLTERGATFETAPRLNAEYGIYHCFLRDPNGYLIEIQKFDEPL